MRKIYIKALVLFSILTTTVNAQNFEWAKDANYIKEADGKGIVTYNQFVYVIGDFIDTLNFGGTPLIANNTDSKSGFLAKYDTLGNFYWSIPIRGTTSLKEVTTDGIAIDKNSTLYVTGKFISGLSVGTTTLTEPNGKKSFYLIKFDSTGTVQWANSQNGSSTVEMEGKRVTVDTAGNAYVCGKLKGGAASFGSFSLNYSTTTVGENGFIAKYLANGTISWAKTITNTTNGKSGVEDLELDAAGNIFIAGKFDDVVTLGDGITQSLTPSGAENFIVAKLNSTGGVVWAFAPGIGSGTNKNNAKTLEVGAGGVVYATGDFDNAISFDNSTLFDYVNTGKNSWVAKWSNTGVLTWVKPHLSGSLSTDEFKTDGLQIDDLGDVLVIGKFTSTVAISGLSSMTSSGGKNTFLVKYNAAGTPQWVKTITGTLDLEGKRLAIDKAGKAIVCGSFKSNATFGGAAGTLNYNGGNSAKNFFIARHASGMYITPAVGINELSKNNIQISVFPNPASSQLNLSWEEEERIQLIKLYDITGKEVFSQSLKNTFDSNLLIDISNLNSGLYFLTATTNQNASVTKKIIKD